MRCKTCKHFERGKWHKCIDPEESDQFGGHCKLLLEMLKLQNSSLIYIEKIYIQDTFGCSMHSGEGNVK